MFRMGKTPKPDVHESEAPRDAATTQSYTPSYANTPRHDSAPTPAPPPRPGLNMGQERRPSEPMAGRAFSESEAVARDIKDGNLRGFVGSGTALTGEVTFKAMLRIDGHLTGRITSDSGTLIVGTTGQVDANIEVAMAVVHGSVNGDIVASQRLELGRAAKVFGNIKASNLVIEEGAIFEGNCLMVQAREALEKKNAPPPEPPKAIEVKPKETAPPVTVTAAPAPAPVAPPVLNNPTPVSPAARELK